MREGPGVKICEGPGAIVRRSRRRWSGSDQSVQRVQHPVVREVGMSEEVSTVVGEIDPGRPRTPDRISTQVVLGAWFRLW